MNRLISILVLALPVLAADTCLDCHAKLTGPLQAPTAAFPSDIHKHAGFTCVSCHGGDPGAAAAPASHSRARGFAGKIPRTATPKMCARCHSDASLIHKYKPQQRVDQLAQYETSVHGKRLATGDTSVANCVDCHSVHDIRGVRDPLSPVHPEKLPQTCARCHADAAHMAKYKIPTGQFDLYRQSVHWEALSKRKDLSAPSCATCHGNHGATPPQVNSVAAVCGTCHALLEDLYKSSPHQPVFEAMGVAGCVACHSNHKVARPSDAFLAGADAVCAQCHDAESAGGKLAARMHAEITGLGAALDIAGAIVASARRSGMEVSEALLRLNDGRERLVKARVAVHAFRGDAVATPVKEGLGIAAEAHRAGVEALKERDYRRLGLALSLIAILITIAALRLKIREIEAPAPGGQESAGR